MHNPVQTGFPARTHDEDVAAPPTARDWVPRHRPAVADHAPLACLAVVGVVAAAMFGGCAPISDEAMGADPIGADEDGTAVDGKGDGASGRWRAIRLHAHGDGSTTFIGFEATSADSQVYRYDGSGKIIDTSQGELLTRGMPWTEGDDGRLCFAIAKDQAVSGWVRGRVHMGCMDGAEIVELPRTEFASRNSYSRRLHGDPAVAVVGHDTLAAVYGQWFAEDSSPWSGSAESRVLARVCDIAAATCETEEVARLADAEDASYGLVALPSGLLAVVQLPRDQHVRFFRRTAMGWETAGIYDTGVMKGTRPLAVAGYGDTAYVLLRPASDHYHPAQSTEILTFDGAGAHQLGHIDGLSVETMDARYTAEHGLVVLAGRRSAAYGGHNLWRLFRADEDFAGRDITTNDSLAVLGPDGQALAVDVYDYWGRPWSFTVEEGTPPRWRDDGVGAGQLDGRDPCFLDGGSSTPTVDHGGAARGHLTGRVTVPTGEALTIEPGTCVIDAHFEVLGRLVARGTEAAPIRFIDSSIALRGGSGHDIDFSWAFFDDSYVDASPFGGPPPFLSPAAIRHIGFDHVSMAAGGIRYRADYGSYLLAHYGGGSVTPPDLPPRAEVVIRNSDLGYGVEPTFREALVEVWSHVDLTVENSRVRDVLGTALMVVNRNNETQLVVNGVDFESVGTGIEVRADEERFEYFVNAFGLRYPEISERLETPVAIDDVTYRAPHPDSVTDPDLGPPAMLLTRTAGEIRRVNISEARSDGIRMVSVGELFVHDSEIYDNGRHGIAIETSVPRGLGPDCAATGGGSIGDYIISWWWHDPGIFHSRIYSNAGAGIDVLYPNIPLQLGDSLLRDNHLGGVRIHNGVIRSPRDWRDGCTRMEAEVTLTLAGDTDLRNNDIIDNGDLAEGIQLESDHRVGVLPASGNYWGAGILDDLVRCVGPCETDPPLTSPVY